MTLGSEHDENGDRLFTVKKEGHFTDEFTSQVVSGLVILLSAVFFLPLL